jgi:hypothetical protein
VRIAHTKTLTVVAISVLQVMMDRVGAVRAKRYSRAARNASPNNGPNG